MPTITELLNALSTDCTVSVDSSPGLVRDIGRKQALRNAELARKRIPSIASKVNVTTIPGFDPPKPIKLKPIELLHAIGRITTQSVPNLADLSSTWAIIRYLWAFDVWGGTQIRPLTLSSTARKLDFHQKTLLSDEMGMGMAWYVMTNHFKTTSAIDVSTALETPGWNIIQQYSASPDYLFFNDPSKDTYVVECKGNQSSYTSALKQLQRGTEQVPSIIFTDRRRSTSIVIATYMDDNFTTVFIIDPPGDNDNPNVEPYDYFEKSGPAQWTVRNDKRFNSDSRLLSQAKMLNYAGFETEALSYLPPSIQERYKSHARSSDVTNRFESSYGPFIGTTQELDTIGNYRVNFSRGILQEIYDRFQLSKHVSVDNENAEVVQISPLPEFSNRFQEASFHVGYVETGIELGFQSISRDGTLMQITIQK